MAPPAHDLALHEGFISAGGGVTCGMAPSLTSASVTEASLMMSRMLAESLSTIGAGTFPVVVTVCHEAVS